LIPFFYGIALLGFISLSSLNFLFLILVSSKAINYALNGPTIKQLYIPTTHDVRFKSQAWIEIFGLRGSRAAGSAFGMLLGPFQAQLGKIAGRAHHALLASYLSFGIIIAWIFIALFLGKKHRTALDRKNVVC
jgi:AAA family ATP:ADP antiporter